MNGQFNSLGSAYRADPIAEGHREQSIQARFDAYRRRVVGRRAVVTSDMDFGEVGTIVGVEGASLVVILDLDPTQRLYFSRHDLAPAN